MDRSRVVIAVIVILAIALVACVGCQSKAKKGGNLEPPPGKKMGGPKQMQDQGGAGDGADVPVPDGDEKDS